MFEAKAVIFKKTVKLLQCFSLLVYSKDGMTFFAKNMPAILFLSIACLIRIKILIQLELNHLSYYGLSA